MGSLSATQREALILAFSDEHFFEVSSEPGFGVGKRTAKALEKKGFIDQDPNYPENYEPADMPKIADALGYEVPDSDDVVEAFSVAMSTVFDTDLEASAGSSLGEYEDVDSGATHDYSGALAVVRFHPRSQDRDELGCVTTLMRMAGFDGHVESGNVWTAFWPE